MFEPSPMPPGAFRHALSVLLGVPPVLLLLALAEGLWLQRQPGGFDWRACWATVGDLVGRRLLGLVLGGTGLVAGAPLWLVPLQGLSAACGLPAWSMARPLHWLVLFVASDALYYLYHRAAHRVHWLWASHAVHHSSAQMALVAALRLGWTAGFTGGTLFFAPLVLLGFPWPAVALVLALNLLYQFGLHLARAPHLGPLEWVLNTPRHHRVHHGCNAAYLDCNFGGVLIVWDRLFGSFVAERADTPPVFGLVQPLHSHNPVVIALHGWWRLACELRQVRGLRPWLRTLFGPPG